MSASASAVTTVTLRRRLSPSVQSLPQAPAATRATFEAEGGGFITGSLPGIPAQGGRGFAHSRTGRARAGTRLEPFCRTPAYAMVITISWNSLLPSAQEVVLALFPPGPSSWLYAPWFPRVLVSGRFCL